MTVFLALGTMISAKKIFMIILYTNFDMFGEAVVTYFVSLISFVIFLVMNTFQCDILHERLERTTLMQWQKPCYEACSMLAC